MLTMWLVVVFTLF